MFTIQQPNPTEGVANHEQSEDDEEEEQNEKEEEPEQQQPQQQTQGKRTTWSGCVSCPPSKFDNYYMQATYIRRLCSLGCSG